MSWSFYDYWAFCMTAHIFLLIMTDVAHSSLYRSVLFSIYWCIWSNGSAVLFMLDNLNTGFEKKSDLSLLQVSSSWRIPLPFMVQWSHSFLHGSRRDAKSMLSVPVCQLRLHRMHMCSRAWNYVVLKRGVCASWLSFLGSIVGQAESQQFQTYSYIRRHWS